jgi:hypothetical protein
MPDLDDLEQDAARRDISSLNRITRLIREETKPYVDAHEEKDIIRFREAREHTDEKFKDNQNTVLILRRDLLDENYGILPQIKQQTTRHNGRLTKIERVMWIVGGAVVALAVSGNAAMLHIITSI